MVSEKVRLESGGRKGEFTYHGMPYDGQTLADFCPETKNCRRLVVGGQKGRLESGRRKGELVMRVEYHMQVMCYSCLQDILCKKIICLFDVSAGKVMCSYKGRTSAYFLPETKNC